MNNLVLLYSTSQQVGKTTLAKELKNRKIISHIDSVALDIKKLSHTIHSTVSYHSLNKDEFYQTKKDQKILNGKSPRDLVCSISDLVQEFYGEDVWATMLHEHLLHLAQKHNQEYNQPFNIVIDDWRRLIESNYFEQQGFFKITKVFLDKEGVKNKPSKKSASYEGNIKETDCDIVFKYDENYSNFEELIGLIQNATQ